MPRTALIPTPSRRCRSEITTTSRQGYLRKRSALVSSSGSDRSCQGWVASDRSFAITSAPARVRAAAAPGSGPAVAAVAAGGGGARTRGGAYVAGQERARQRRPSPHRDPAAGRGGSPRASGRAREAGLGTISDLSQSALTEVRGLLRTLDEHPAAIRPGSADLERLADRLASGDRTITVRRSGTGDALPSAVDHTAYRMVQEALTNAVQHADANEITVHLRQDDHGLRIEVHDNGTPGRRAPGGGAGHPGDARTGTRTRRHPVGGTGPNGRLAGPRGPAQRTRCARGSGRRPPEGQRPRGARGSGPGAAPGERPGRPAGHRPPDQPLRRTLSRRATPELDLLTPHEHHALRLLGRR